MLLGIAHHKPGTDEGWQYLEALRALVENISGASVGLFTYESEPPPADAVAILALGPGGHYYSVKSRVERLGARVCGPIPPDLIAGHIVGLSLELGCSSVTVAYWPGKRFSKEHKEWLERSASIASRVLGKVEAKPYTELSGSEACTVTLSLVRGRLLNMAKGARIVDGSLLPRSMAAIARWIARECAPQLY
jgi:hypothetical protein